jgi:hypothetical protein
MVSDNNPQGKKKARGRRIHGLVTGNHVDMEALEVLPEGMNRIGDSPQCEGLRAKYVAEFVSDGWLGGRHPTQQHQSWNHGERHADGHSKGASVRYSREQGFRATSKTKGEEGVSNQQPCNNETNFSQCLLRTFFVIVSSDASGR